MVINVNEFVKKSPEKRRPGVSTNGHATDWFDVLWLTWLPTCRQNASNFSSILTGEQIFIPFSQREQVFLHAGYSSVHVASHFRPYFRGKLAESDVFEGDLLNALYIQYGFHRW